MSLTDFNVSLTALLLRQHNPCILFNYEAPVWVSIHLVLDFSVNNWHFLGGLTMRLHVLWGRFGPWGCACCVGGQGPLLWNISAFRDALVLFRFSSSFDPNSSLINFWYFHIFSTFFTVLCLSCKSNCFSRVGWHPPDDFFRKGKVSGVGPNLTVDIYVARLPRCIFWQFLSGCSSPTTHPQLPRGQFDRWWQKPSGETRGGYW